MLGFGANRLVSLSAAAGNGAKPDTVSAWNLASPQAAPAQFSVPDGDNSLSPDGSLTYGGDVSTNAVPNYVWDTASGRKIATVPLSFKQDAPVSDTGVLAFTGQTGVTLWNAHSGTVTGFLPYPASYSSPSDATITISADGSLVALTSTTGKTYVWSSRTHEITATLTEPAPSALGENSEFSADGSTLAVQASSSAGTSSTYIWNLADHSVPRALHNFLALSANGKLAAVANDSAVDLVEIASGKVVRTLHAPSGTGPVSVAAFSRDGTKLAAGDYNVNYTWNLAG
jgi:WD40 repeat protein